MGAPTTPTSTARTPTPDEQDAALRRANYTGIVFDSELREFAVWISGKVYGYTRTYSEGERMLSGLS